MKISKTKELTILSVSAAFSIILSIIINVPILPAAPFLRYDPGDIPIMVAGFLFGVQPAIIVAFVVAFIQGIILSSDGGIIGMIMHFIATSSFVGMSSFIYNKNKTRHNMFLGLMCGGVTMVVAMILLNLVVTPIFLGVPQDVVFNMLLPIIIPFNLIKLFINFILIWLLYKPISILIFRE